MNELTVKDDDENSQASSDSKAILDDYSRELEIEESRKKLYEEPLVDFDPEFKDQIEVWHYS